MRVLLLGATGLLGNNVLKTLVSCGHDVTMIVRNLDAIVGIKVPVEAKQEIRGAEELPQTVFRTEDSDIKIIRGSLTDANHVSCAAKGCQAIINCAGDTDMSHRHLEDYYPVNRDLCATILDVAVAENVSTIVHVSTANTIGYGDVFKPANEQAPMQAPFTESWYALSKLDGEQILLNEHPEFRTSGMSSLTGCRVIIINPGFIIGKYDEKPSSGKLLLAGWRKRIMLVPPGGKSFVGADTVAQAIVAALTKGRSGQRYLVTGENLSFRQLFRLESRVGGYRQYIVVMPRLVCRLVGAIGDVLAVCGLRVSFTRRNVRQLLVSEHYTSQKMEKELGVAPIPIVEAIGSFIKYKRI